MLSNALKTSISSAVGIMLASCSPSTNSDSGSADAASNSSTAIVDGNSSTAGDRSPHLSWVTLGTEGGPILNAERSQPSNVLMVNNKPWLVDCGDGCMERLAAIGHKPADLNVAFISHLHMDHVGGVQGLIGLRWMDGATGPLTIYGPPGTDKVVAGLLASMQPTFHIGDGVGATTPPQKLVKVVIIKGGEDMMIDGVRVRTVRNSHFDDPPGHPLDDGTETLSYRFDQNGYAIGYTGDTGPSDLVTNLMTGVNLMVSEVVDVASIVSTLPQTHPGLSPQNRAALIKHLNTQHLTPQQSGRIAQQANAGHLVFTHLSITGPTARFAPKLIQGAKQTYKGPVDVARDLDRF